MTFVDAATYPLGYRNLKKALILQKKKKKKILQKRMFS